MEENREKEREKVTIESRRQLNAMKVESKTSETDGDSNNNNERR